MSVDLSDMPKGLRLVITVLVGFVLIGASAVGAYSGGAAKAGEIADTKDAIIRKDLDDHKERDDERFADLKSRLERMDSKLDRLIERGR